MRFFVWFWPDNRPTRARRSAPHPQSAGERLRHTPGGFFFSGGGVHHAHHAHSPATRAHHPPLCTASQCLARCWRRCCVAASLHLGERAPRPCCGLATCRSVLQCPSPHYPITQPSTTRPGACCCCVSRYARSQMIFLLLFFLVGRGGLCRRSVRRCAARASATIAACLPRRLLSSSTIIACLPWRLRSSSSRTHSSRWCHASLRRVLALPARCR